MVFHSEESMAKNKSNLNSYARNFTSQFGEDGIIEEILIRLGAVVPKYFVEFGAWDGVHLSNTHSLAKLGWSGLYIE
jgi:hypothetical protein